MLSVYFNLLVFHTYKELHVHVYAKCDVTGLTAYMYTHVFGRLSISIGFTELL